MSARCDNTDDTQVVVVDGVERHPRCSLTPNHDGKPLHAEFDSQGRFVTEWQGGRYTVSRKRRKT